MNLKLLEKAMREESSPIFFIGRSDAPKYDINWSENENLIDCFIPEILILKVRLK